MSAEADAFFANVARDRARRAGAGVVSSQRNIVLDIFRPVAFDRDNGYDWYIQLQGLSIIPPDPTGGWRIRYFPPDPLD